MEKTLQGTKLGVLILTLLMSASLCKAQGTDIRWLRSVHRGSTNSTTLEAFSFSSYGLSVAVPAAQLAYGFLGDDSASKSRGLQTFASLVITTGITYGIKYAINRPRPYQTYPDIVPYEYESGHSMPSGHTSTAFSTATSVSLQYRKWYIVAPAFAYAGLIGYSRMRLGAHYPSDVLVAALVGGGSAWLSHKGQQWLTKNRKK